MGLGQITSAVAAADRARHDAAHVTGQELFDEVVRLTGVSTVLAPGMIKRSLADGGVTVEAGRPQDYEAALPRIRARLKAYVAPDEAEARTRAIAERMAELRNAPRSAPAAPSRPPGEKSGEKDLGKLGEKTGEKNIAGLAGDLAPYSLDGTDTTHHGRRWTADEQKQIDQARKDRDRK